ncbi:MAG: DNA translocase FtsK 4TM domain-containing protein, partial [Muribaculaceae bacterium]|nr:DNA translocase FtsK 4TM domain-containing protein [Muribaculaceae bacterium]
MSEYYDPYMSEGTASEPEQQPQPRRQQPAAERQRTRSKAKPKKAPRSEAMVVFDARAKMFFGIVLLLFAAYCLIATISAILHPGADQAAIQYNSLGQIAGSQTPLSNAAGPAGAKLSNFFLIRFLGLGSFVIIYYIVMVGLKLLGWSKARFWPLTLKSLQMAITISIVAASVSLTISSPLRLGGNPGYYLALFLNDTLSPFGLWGINIALISLAVIVFLTQITKGISAIKRKLNERPKPSQPAEPSEPSEHTEPSEFSENSECSENSELPRALIHI